MAKKKKKPLPQPTRAAIKTPAAPQPGSVKKTLREMARHPVLVLAWSSTALTILAVALAIRFRDDLSVGTISDPASALVWGAVALTCFARYWRERSETKRSS
jgi:hypothetical protein